MGGARLGEIRNKYKILVLKSLEDLGVDGKTMLERI
jgi:hypothetical protein